MVVSHYPNGDDSRVFMAVLIAIAYAVAAGAVNGLLVGWLGLNSIIATLGMNALLFGAVLGISDGIPRSTTRLLSSIAAGRTLGVPHAVVLRARGTAGGRAADEEDGCRPSVRGRRRQPAGRPRRPACGSSCTTGIAFVWAQLLFCLAGVLLAGMTAQPTAFQGNAYLLPSVAVVVLGGTSLLGGRGFPASTVVAALFLSQLDQFVLALGVPFAVQTLVQAAALAGGVALYTVNWAALRARFARQPDRGRPVRVSRAAYAPHPRTPPVTRAPHAASRTKEHHETADLPAVLALTAGLATALAGCGSSDDSPADPSSQTTQAAAPLEGAPSWCGSKEITLGLLDGFGGNSWRLVTTASGEDEVEKCPSVTDYLYADGQGDTQKAISDIQGMVAPGVDAMVVFPDAGKAILPALRSAYKAGVVDRALPQSTRAARTASTTTPTSVPTPTTDAQRTGRLDQEELPRRRQHPVPVAARPATARAPRSAPSSRSELPADKYTFIGEQPFEVTNWDPSQTQQVLTAAIAKYPKIDVIVSDFGPSLVGALPEFAQERPLDPGARHLGRQRAVLLLRGQQGGQPGLRADDGGHRQRQRPAGRPVRGGRRDRR